MAPLTKRWKKALAAAIPPPVIDPADRLSKLPEEIQAQILSFLPAQEAVRTSVLARTWHHVWRFTRRLHITGKSVQDVRKFVGRLIHVRHDGLEVSPLDACEIRFNPWDWSVIRLDRCVELDDYRFNRCIDNESYARIDGVDMDRLNRWIRRVLECQIQMLRVDISAQGSLDAYLQMSNMQLVVSRHLTRLELKGVRFVCLCLDLDGCPALEHLEIKRCCFSRVMKMTSRSLKHLVITSCESEFGSNRIQISVPRLVCLWLDNLDMRTPLLDTMPELVGAKVHIGSYLDECNCEDEIDCYHVMWSGDTSDIDFDSVDVQDSIYYAGQITKKCLVLEGLAQAKDLVLIADNSTYIFRRDLRWCPTFSKLKTLVLNEVYWRKPAADCSALACMLQHSPILEKLTLILDNIPRNRSKYKAEMKGYPDAKVKSTKISQHLQIVEIKCDYVNETFLCILNFLGTLNICFEIRVTQNIIKEQQSH